MRADLLVAGEPAGARDFGDADRVPPPKRRVAAEGILLADFQHAAQMDRRIVAAGLQRNTGRAGTVGADASMLGADQASAQSERLAHALVVPLRRAAEGILLADRADASFVAVRRQRPVRGALAVRAGVEGTRRGQSRSAKPRKA